MLFFKIDSWQEVSQSNTQDTSALFSLWTSNFSIKHLPRIDVSNSLPNLPCSPLRYDAHDLITEISQATSSRPLKKSQICLRRWSTRRPPWRLIFDIHGLIELFPSTMSTHQNFWCPIPFLSRSWWWREDIFHGDLGWRAGCSLL